MGSPENKVHMRFGGYGRLRWPNTGPLLGRAMAQWSHTWLLASVKKEEQQEDLPLNQVGSLGVGDGECKGQVREEPH